VFLVIFLRRLLLLCDTAFFSTPLSPKTKRKHPLSHGKKKEIKTPSVMQVYGIMLLMPLEKLRKKALLAPVESSCSSTIPFRSSTPPPQ